MPNEFKIKNGFFSEGNSNITGSLDVTGGITGSLQGTATLAIALVGGGGGGGGSSFPFTGSAQITGSLGVTGSINGIIIGTGNGSNTTNIAIGRQALQSGSGFCNNIAIGERAGARLANNKTPTDNVFIGNQAGYGIVSNGVSSNPALTGNIAIGKKAGYSLGSKYCFGTRTGGDSYNGYFTYNVTGFSTTCNNVFIGNYAGLCTCPQGVTNGSGNYYTRGNTAIGHNTLRANTTGCYNTAIGFDAMRNGTSGDCNIAIGRYTLNCNNGGSQQLAIGHRAMARSTSGGQNVAIGPYNLYCTAGGTRNIAVGQRALLVNTTGTANIAMGSRALYSNTTGFGNTAIGQYALRFNTIGQFNIAIGYRSLYSNTTGCNNIAMGRYALRQNISGSNNTVIGYMSLRYNTTGSCNVVLGHNAARSNSANGQLLNLSSSIVIGACTRPSASNDINEIIIGNSATGLGSNTTVIGNSSTTRACIFGQLTATAFTGSLFGTASFAANGGVTQIIAGSNVSISPGDGTGAVTITAGGGGGGGSSFPYIGIAQIIGALEVTGSTNLNGVIIGTGSGANGVSNISIGRTTAFSSSLNTAAINNIAIGSGSMLNLNSGSNNIALGQNSLRATTSGSRNIAIGQNTLRSTTTTNGNVAIGYQALQSGSVTTSVAIGSKAGGRFLGSCNNVFVGYQAGYGAISTNNGSILCTINNVAIGTRAGCSLGVKYTVIQDCRYSDYSSGLYSLGYCTQAHFNTFIGHYAGACTCAATPTSWPSFNPKSSFSKHNVAVGYRAFAGNTEGYRNIAIGSNTLSSNTTGHTNTAIGYNALFNNTAGTYNTAIGRNALSSNTTGTNNIVLGRFASLSNTTGTGNIAIGYSTSQQNNTGVQNIAIGRLALFTNSVSKNIAIGSYASQNNSTGTGNTAIGQCALRYNTTGSCNIVFGYSAARLDSVNATLTNLSGSIIIGANTKPSASNDINEIIIGNSAIGLGSNTTVIGNSNTTRACIFGRVTVPSLIGQVVATPITSNTASLNLTGSNFYTLALTNGVTTHLSASNITAGQTVNIRVTQGNAGTGKLSFAPTFKSGSFFTGSAVANAVDIVTLISFDSSSIFLSAIRNLV